MTRTAIDLRPLAFAAIGHLVLAMKEEDLVIGVSNSMTVKILQKPSLQVVVTMSGIIYDKLPHLFDLVRRGLHPSRLGSGTKGVGGARTRSSAWHCTADLVEALHSLAETYLTELINNIFSSGLGEDLISCLYSIGTSIPSQQVREDSSWCTSSGLCLAYAHTLKL